MRKILIVLLFFVFLGNLCAEEIIPLKVVFRGDALRFVGYIWETEHLNQFAIVNGIIMSMHRVGDSDFVWVYLRTTGRPADQLLCMFPLSEIDNLRQYRRGQTLHLQGQIRTDSSARAILTNCVVLEDNNSSLER